MAKKLKSAAEIAEFIRQALKEPELRVAVFSGPHGWHAKAYAAPHVARRNSNEGQQGLARTSNAVRITIVRDFATSRHAASSDQAVRHPRLGAVYCKPCEFAVPFRRSPENQAPALAPT